MKPKAEHDFKRHMFDYLNDDDDDDDRVLCEQVRSLSTKDRDRPVLESNCTAAAAAASTAGDVVQQQQQKLKCQVYESEFWITPHASANVKKVTATIVKRLTAYADEGDFTDVDDNIVAVTVLGTAPVRDNTSSNATKTEAVGKGGMIGGIVAGLAVFSALLFGLHMAKRARRRL
eukprot:CAMPEP_0172488784 /NCGR_PEP_ID=MMETSP1066-20121228/18516_1 /TAXON_ID=671091 /ORGANISM="Coscinodiscus wailesii, Strain CCMP2513" /LENGTH=174 /DNA_ID=CAMNT_0013256241 /DNA_START=526 /DNA_END=1053 /DNA_ORIENTATION=-